MHKMGKLCKSEVPIAILGLLPLVFIEIVSGDDFLVVKTSSGAVRGQLEDTFTNKQARAFYGIPYAQPPIGKLRFKPPVPVTPWTEVLDATKKGPPCYQHYTKESFLNARKTGAYIRRPWSEDCLTINAWTPTNLTSDNIPVYYFIQGGGFMTGTGSSYNLPTMSIEADFVIFTSNYRLGPFGFLTLGTADFPGNLGLMDQKLTLDWIRKNCHAFGGKTEAIFVLGIGAGGASVGYHIIYDGNKGMFKTGVVAGGSTCSWAWQSKEQAVKVGKVFSTKLGCDSVNVTTRIECLQNVHPEDILDANRVGIIFERQQFKPNIDGSFIKEPPMEAMKAGRFNNVTVITYNLVSDASLIFNNLNEDLLTGTDPALSSEGFRKAMKRAGLGRSPTEIAAIEEWYLNENYSYTGQEIRDAAVKAYTDGLFHCCSNLFINYATENGVLTYKGIFDIPDPNYPAWIGSHHSAGIPVVSGEALDPRSNFGPELKQATLFIMRTLGYYAKKKAIEFQELMPLYNLEEKPYMLWVGTDISHRKNYKSDECVLWDQILPQLRNNVNVCPIT